MLSILKECPANVGESFLTGHVAAAVSGTAARGCPRSRCGIDPQAKRLGVGASLCTDCQNIRFGDDFNALHRRVAVCVAVSAGRTGAKSAMLSAVVTLPFAVGEGMRFIRRGGISAGGTLRCYLVLGVGNALTGDGQTVIRVFRRGVSAGTGHGSLVLGREIGRASCRERV